MATDCKLGAMRRFAAVLLLFVACATSSEVDTLYFGTARANGVVSDAEWKTFVAEVIAPIFPGFTEWNATGHWRGAEEATHVVQIVHLPRQANDHDITRIISEYKRRFDQESVFWVRGRGFVAPQ